MRTHTINKYYPEFQPAYLANGLIGLRVGSIPLDGKALVNGFTGLNEKMAVESYALAPYPIGGNIIIDDISLSDRPDLTFFKKQSYDFSCGELISQFDFRVKGRTAHVEVLTLCNRSLPSIVLQEVRVEVDKPCRLQLQAIMDPSGLPGDCLLRSMPEEKVDAVLHWQGRGGLSTCGAAFVTEFIGDGLVGEKRNNWGYESDMQLKEYIVQAKPTRRYSLRQIGSLVPSIMHQEPHWQAVRMLGLAVWHGFDKVREDNRKAWQELWKGRINILGGDKRWQDIVDAAFFYLHSTIHPSTPCSIAPFGLGQRDAYLGHVFWDTESFMFFPVLLTNPDAARAILDYRTRMLQAAKFNAALNGYRGIQFPWQSLNYGCEVTRVSAGAAAGVGEQHINMDVAFAFAQYVHATGDDIFLHEQAWPVLKGVAEWIVSRVTKSERGYEIRYVTGIDESLDNVHNNAYTNISAIVVLREAIVFAKRLGFTPPQKWIDVEKNMFIPIDQESNVIQKHDGYTYKGGVCNPEVLMAYFPCGYSHSEDVDQATYRYYLKLAHTYLGYPMQSAFLGVFAARMGNRKQAREFFEAGNFPYLNNSFMQFTEGSQKYWKSERSKITPFITHTGGLLMGMLLGLPGLQIGPGEPKEWCKFPVVMPEGWDGIEVDRIWVRGKPARLLARHGDTKARIEFLV